MTAAPPIDPVRKKRLAESFIQHATLAEFYRWCQHREPHPHGVRSHDVEVKPDGRTTLTAELYRYDADRPGGPLQHRTPLRCTAEMTAIVGALPRLANIDIAAAGARETGSFADPYPANRVRSLIHHFTSLVENPARDPAPFRALLTDDFALHYVDPPVAGWAMLGDWVTGRLASVVASQHRIRDVALEADGGDYVVAIAMESEALFPDGSGVISTNKQTWRVVDDPAERYARLREVRIDREAVRRFDLPETG